MAKSKPETSALRPWMVTLGTAVLLAAGYQVSRSLDRSTKALPTPPPKADVNQAAAEGTLTFSLEGPATVEPTDKNLQARALVEPGARVRWTLENATYEGDPNLPDLTWTPKGPGDVLLKCEADMPDGRRGMAMLRVRGLSVPGLERFEVVPTRITVGQRAALVWTAKEAAKVKLDPGGVDLTRFDPESPAHTVQPTETTTYTLTVTNLRGATVTRTCTLEVFPAPSEVTLRAEPVANHATAFVLHGEFKGGTAELFLGEASLGRSSTSPFRIQVDKPNPGATARLVVTNPAGASLKASLVFPAK